MGDLLWQFSNDSAQQAVNGALWLGTNQRATRAAQDQNEFWAGPTSTKNLPLDNRAQIDQAPAFQGTARIPPQVILNHTQLQLSQHAPSQAQDKHNTFQPTQSQLINDHDGLLTWPAHSRSASRMSSTGAQIPGTNSNVRAQSQSGSMYLMTTPLRQGGMSGGAPSSILNQSPGTVPIRRPTAEEVTSAKTWVEEQRRTALNRSSYTHVLSQF